MFCVPLTVVTVTTSATCMAVTSITTTPAITTLSPSDLAQYARQSNLKGEIRACAKGAYNPSFGIKKYVDVVYRTLLALLTIVVVSLMIGTTMQLFPQYFTVRGIKELKMNSKERHELRYQRRKQRRLEKKNRYKDYYDYDKVFTFENLYRSYEKCCAGVSWKPSTQLYKANALMNINRTYKSLRNESYIPKKLNEFDIIERGKQRHIQSPTMNDRIVQRCFCDYSLMPIICRTIIYDNSACVKGRGLSFTIRRMTRHLERYYREQGSNEGYALLFDFSQYFKNIKHDVALSILDEKIPDKRLVRLAELIIRQYGSDGLGLGSQVSQCCALALPDKLDHYIKEKLKIKYYCRYMDDGCIIHPDKDYLRYCLQEIKSVCNELGIIINEKKTQIVKIKSGIKFLKARFILTKTGRVIRKSYAKSATKMRKKLKALKLKLDAGAITFADVWTPFQSWLGYHKQFHGYWARRRVCALFNNLFYTGGNTNGLANSFTFGT